MDPGRVRLAAMYALRLLTLASTTFCGGYFLIAICIFVAIYNREHHRFPGFVTWLDFVKIALLGFGFIGSAVAYRVLVHATDRRKN